MKGFLLKKYITFLHKLTFEIQKEIILYAHNLFELEASLINSNYQFKDAFGTHGELPDLSKKRIILRGFYPEYETIFQTLLEKSGTPEFPHFYIRFRLKRNLKHTFKLIDSAYRRWDSTFYAFYEDWRFREELFSFISHVEIIAIHTKRNYSSKINEKLIPVITRKREYLEQLINKTPNPDNTDFSSLKHFFSLELYKLQKETRNQSIEEDFNKTSSEIEKILNKVEVDLTASLEKLPEKSGVVRSPEYEEGIRKSEIYFFSPGEFIEFDCIPPFLSRINSITEDFKAKFEKIVNEFSDFDQITDFSLDTAISMVNIQNDREQIVLMFREGLARSLYILDRIAELGNEKGYRKEDEVTEAFINFIENIKKLEDNDNIVHICSMLLKSKAFEEFKKKRKTITNIGVSSAYSFISFSKKLTRAVITFYQSIRKRLKLEKVPQTVSSEISNYLAEINRKIYKLPVIYRYLFENTPLKEVNLFLSRQPEIEILDNALKNWKSGNFAATLVIGENGSGKSSLLHNYVKTLKGSYKISYFSINSFYYNEDDFYKLIQDIFGNKDLTNERSIFEYLANSEGQQQIIILDGLERVFVRKTGGFNCIHKLLSFIVSTNKLAFWICSVSLHAFNYLDKTISLKEYFDYLVELHHLSSEEVRNIVLKRHRLSGYILQYENNFKQSTENEKNKIRQNQLETEFFNELNKFANSNLSLSLYYWLESISEFTEKELYIKRFKAPDFSFLETLSSEKIYTLLLIVLHGKIKIDLHAKICNQSIEKSTRDLTILKEDSIITLKGDYYIINGILFRHIVQLLKSKNLIH